MLTTLFASPTPFALLRGPVSALVSLLLIKFFIFLRPFWMDLTNPTQALDRFLILLRLLTLPNILLSFTILFRLASLLALFDKLNLLFLTVRLICFIKTKQVAFLSLLRCSTWIHSWLCFISLYINSLLAYLPSSVSCYL